MRGRLVVSATALAPASRARGQDESMNEEVARALLLLFCQSRSSVQTTYYGEDRSVGFSGPKKAEPCVLHLVVHEVVHEKAALLPEQRQQQACERTSFLGGFEPPFLLPYPTGCS